MPLRPTTLRRVPASQWCEEALLFSSPAATGRGVSQTPNDSWSPGETTSRRREEACVRSTMGVSLSASMTVGLSPPGEIAGRQGEEAYVPSTMGVSLSAVTARSPPEKKKWLPIQIQSYTQLTCPRRRGVDVI